MPMDEPFWKSKPLGEMTPAEWESLCDHCGRCCLVKLEDEDSGEIFTTTVVCALYDTERGGCSDYARRFSRMPDCIDLSPGNVAAIPWLPATCAYRLIAAGRDLPSWHPLLNGGDRGPMREAGISVLGEVMSESAVAIEDLPGLIRRWPFMDEADEALTADAASSGRENGKGQGSGRRRDKK